MSVEPTLSRRRVFVGVGGSVAAFKACDVVTGVRKRGGDARVAMTDAAAHFVSAPLLQAMSGHPVAASLWDSPDTQHGMGHLDISSWCEVQVMVAASADLMTKLALGLAADTVTTTVLASRAPLVVAPGMEPAMWEHPATQGHVTSLLARGAYFVGPVRGRLASGREGTGRMAEPEAIVAAIEEVLGPSR